MKCVSKIKEIFNNSGQDKLFLTALPAITALIFSTQCFKYNITNAVIAIICAGLIQLSVQIFDNFYDFITGKSDRRKELEQTGIRGMFKKCDYMYKDEYTPRFYFYISLSFFIISALLLILLCINIKSYIILVIFPILILFGLILYHPKFSKITLKTGCEIYTAVLCAPILMCCVFYISAKCLTPQILSISFIYYFFIYNLCYISSVLNLKPDTITQKTTFPILLNNKNYEIYFSLFFTIFPFILTYLFTTLEILPKLSYLTFIILPNALWHFYLMYKYNTNPEKNIKWHILMGDDKDKDFNEQNNYSWYTVRYNFARNIFIAYFILISLALIASENINIF